MAVSKPDFTRQFGSAKTDLTPISNSNYVQGWDYVGSTPPTKNDFTYLQNLADQRAIWLYENYGSGRILRYVPFTNSGIYTPSPDAKKIIVEVFGGGAGGRSTVSSVSYQIGGGGGAGGYVRGIMTNIPASVNVTVGSGGASDGAGGSSLFGTYITALGGLPGALTATTDASAAAAAGGGTGGSFSFDSANVTILIASRGGPGGPGVISGAMGFAGNGGNSFSGGGGLGPTTSSNIVGNDAGQYGAGGSGAVKRVNNSDANIGGLGSKGYVLITEFA